MALLEDIREAEGFSPTVYKDTAGKSTIGFGHRIVPGDGLDRNSKITEEQAEALFKIDINKAFDDAKSVVPEFDKLDDARRDVFVEAAFRLGRRGLKGFKDTLGEVPGAIESGDFNQTADFFLDSEMAISTPRRTGRMAEQLRSGLRVETENEEEESLSVEVVSEFVDSLTDDQVTKLLDQERSVNEPTRQSTPEDFFPKETFAEKEQRSIKDLRSQFDRPLTFEDIIPKSSRIKGGESPEEIQTLLSGIDPSGQPVKDPRSFFEAPVIGGVTQRILMPMLQAVFSTPESLAEFLGERVVDKTDSALLGAITFGAVFGLTAGLRSPLRAVRPKTIKLTEKMVVKEASIKEITKRAETPVKRTRAQKVMDEILSGDDVPPTPKPSPAPPIDEPIFMRVTPLGEGKFKANYIGRGEAGRIAAEGDLAVGDIAVKVKPGEPMIVVKREVDKTLERMGLTNDDVLISNTTDAVTAEVKRLDDIGSLRGADPVSRDIIDEVKRGLKESERVPTNEEISQLTSTKGTEGAAIANKVKQTQRMEPKKYVKGSRIWKPLESILRRFGDVGRRTADDLARVIDEVPIASGQVRVATVKALKGMPDEFTQGTRFVDHVEGKVVDLEIEKWFQRIKIVTDKQAKEIVEVGVGTRLADGKIVPFQPKERFFPRVIDPEKWEKISFREKRLFRQRIAEEILAGAEDISEAALETKISAIITRMERRSGSMEFRATRPAFNKGIFITDPRQAYAISLSNEAERLALLKRWGLRNQKGLLTNVRGGVSQRARLIGEETGDELTAQFVQESLEVALGLRTLDLGDKTLQAIRNYHVIHLGWVRAYNLAQPLLGLSLAPKAFIKATLKRAFSSLSKAEGRELAQKLNLIGTDAIADLGRYELSTGGTGSGFARRMVRIYGIQQSENKLAAFFSHVSQVHIDDAIVKLRINPTSKKWLKEFEALNIDPRKVISGTLTETERLVGVRVLARKMLLRPSAAEMPPAFQTQLGKTVTQFRRSTYQMARELILRGARGDFKALALLLVLGELGGDLVLGTKAAIRDTIRTTLSADIDEFGKELKEWYDRDRTRFTTWAENMAYGFSLGIMMDSVAIVFGTEQSAAERVSRATPFAGTIVGGLEAGRAVTKFASGEPTAGFEAATRSLGQLGGTVTRETKRALTPRPGTPEFELRKAKSRFKKIMESQGSNLFKELFFEEEERR